MVPKLTVPELTTVRYKAVKIWSEQQQAGKGGSHYLVTMIVALAGVRTFAFSE